MNVRELNTIDQLQDYREVWEALLGETAGATFFHTLEWLEVYWRHFGEGQRLKVLLLDDAGKTTGILPLVVKTERTRIGGLRYLTYPMDHWGSFYGPLGADPDGVWATALEYLDSGRRDWDVLEPRWVSGEAGRSESLKRLLQSAGHTPLRTEIQTTGVIELTGSWDDYLATRDSKWRNNARRWRRRCEELGEVTHLRYRPEAGADTDPGWRHYEDCLRVAAKSWQATSTTGTTLTHDSVADFLRDLHAAAARRGCLDVNLLQLAGETVAFTYNYVLHGNVFSLRSGFDPAVPVKGLGGVLYVEAVKDSFARGDWRYDLGAGNLDIKRKLLTHVLHAYRLSCFKRWSWRQQLVRYKRRRQDALAVVAN